jgi:hypothetical protein
LTLCALASVGRAKESGQDRQRVNKIEGKEGFMLIADMIHSCSNSYVAEAAVACIGGVFADRVAATASKNGLEVGGFVSVVVREFARSANAETLQALGSKVAGADQPLLSSLAHVLEPKLEPATQRVEQWDEDVVTGMFGGSRSLCGSAIWAH